MRRGSDKRPPTLSNCYCCSTNPFLQEKVWSKYLQLFHFRGFDGQTTPGSAPASSVCKPPPSPSPIDDGFQASDCPPFAPGIPTSIHTQMHVMETPFLSLSWKYVFSTFLNFGSFENKRSYKEILIKEVLCKIM